MRSDDAPSSDSSDLEGPPFPGVPEDTKEYIRQLLREKDEARQNYSQETIRSQRLATELVVAQSDRAVVWAKLSAADSSVACKSPSSCNVFFSPQTPSLTFRLSSSRGVGPSPPRRSRHHNGLGECSRRHCRLPPAGYPSSHLRGRRTWGPPRCSCGPRHSPVPIWPRLPAGGIG